MKLRSYQDDFVLKSLEALKKYSGVLGVGATGMGKTVCLSAIAKEYDRVLVLQHQDSLLEQNSKTFSWVCPDRPFGFVDQKNDDFDKDVIFAMRQTLIRRIAKMRHFDLIIIDEAHHTPCAEYVAIIEAAREINPDVKLFGCTATPERADKKDMSRFYDVISHKINIEDLIKMGYLVQPRAYVIKVADYAELRAANNNDEAVEAILNVKATNERVISEWKDKCTGRSTIAFCANINHAIDVAQAFNDAGIKATHVDGKMSTRERKKRLRDFDKGKYQVLTNAVLLTEGYDCQRISAVLMLRGSASKSSLIQMVGRGLRKLDPQRYPGVYKADCVVLDFGTALTRHSNLDSGDRLSFGDEYDAVEGAVIQCEQCGAACEPSDKECPDCGYKLKEEAGEGAPVENEEKVIRDFTMSEVELMKCSSYHYVRFRDGGRIASAWTAWALTTQYKGLWYAVAAKHKCRAKIIGYSPNKIETLATCDDFLSQHGDPVTNNKDQPWLRERATRAQMAILPPKYQGHRLSKYQAICLMVLTAPKRWTRIQTLIKKHFKETNPYEQTTDLN